MPAKPVIDMIAGVRGLEDAEQAEPLLARLGYHRAVHRVDAVLFNRISEEVHTHHLHLTVPGTTSGANDWRSATRCAPTLRSSPSTPG